MMVDTTMDLICPDGTAEEELPLTVAGRGPCLAGLLWGRGIPACGAWRSIPGTKTGASSEWRGARIKRPWTVR